LRNRGQESTGRHACLQELGVYPGGSIYFQSPPGKAEQTLSAWLVWPNWVHLTLLWSADKFTLYVNWAEVFTTSRVWFPDSTLHLILGDTLMGTLQDFWVLYDDVRVDNAGMSALQMTYWERTVGALNSTVAPAVEWDFLRQEESAPKYGGGHFKLGEFGETAGYTWTYERARVDEARGLFAEGGDSYSGGSYAFYFALWTEQPVTLTLAFWMQFDKREVPGFTKFLWLYEPECALEMDGLGTLRIRGNALAGSSSTGEMMESGFMLDSLTSTHVALRLEAKELSLLVNGVFWGSTRCQQPPRGNPYFYVGRAPVYISELKVYDVVLWAYQMGLQGQVVFADPVGHWRFETQAEGLDVAALEEADKAHSNYKKVFLHRGAFIDPAISKGLSLPERSYASVCTVFHPRVGDVSVSAWVQPYAINAGSVLSFVAEDVRLPDRQNVLEFLAILELKMKEDGELLLTAERLANPEDKMATKVGKFFRSYAWAHVSMSYYSSGNFELYFNGEKAAVGTVFIHLPVKLCFYLGTFDPEEGRFNGLIDDLRIYKRGLLATEVAEMLHLHELPQEPHGLPANLAPMRIVLP